MLQSIVIFQDITSYFFSSTYVTLLSPTTIPSVVDIKRSVYFNRPILFDFGRLAHALDNHRRSNLLEARNVSARDIVTVKTVSHSSVLDVVEDIDHDMF